MQNFTKSYFSQGLLFLSSLAFYLFFLPTLPIGQLQAQTVSIANSHAGLSLKAGEVITYTVTVTNNTSSTMNSVSISDPVPAAPAVFVPNSLLVGGSNLSCTVPSTITNAILISGFSLLPEENLVYRFQMKIPEAYSGTATISHTATSGAGSATVSNTISAIPTLSLVKSGTTEVTAGTVNITGLIYYKIVITNTGTATAKSVVFKDKLDLTKVNFIATNNVLVSQDYLGSYTVNKGAAITDDSVRVTLGDIPRGASATIKFTIRTKGTVSGSLTNTATATSTNLTAGTSAGIATSNTTTHTVNGATSCTNRNIYYLSATGNNGTAEVNNPNKPWVSFKVIIDLINSAGGNSVLRFLDAYYPTTASGSTNPVLTTPCVTIDGNYCIFDRNSGASVGFLGIANGANGDTIRNLRLTNFNKSPDCSFDITGSSPASPITGLVLDDVKIYATQSVKATSLTNVSGAKFNNCEWSNNSDYGAIDIVDAKVTFTDCNFYCNKRGGFGGAIDAKIKSGGASSDAHFTELTFIRGEFSGNEGKGGGGDGGALCMGVGTLTIDGTKFNCNSSSSPTGTAGGGAIRLHSNSNSSGKPIATIRNAVFYNNSGVSTTSGGAILGTSTGALTLDKCIFKNNVSGNGSAINVSSPFTINNCIFEGNSTGAAIVGSPSVMDSTIVKGNSGAGVSGTIGTLSNSLICSNTGVNMSAHPTTVINSLYGTSAEAINNTVITLLNETASSATAGWNFSNPTTILPLNNATAQGSFVFTNATTTNAIQQSANGFGGAADGFWLLEDNDVVETPTLNMLNYPATITVAYKAKRIQSNVTQTSTAQTVTLQYSTDGGSNWLAAHTFTVGTSWADATAFTIPQCATATMKLRWFKTTIGATRQDVGIDNIQITYNTTAIQQAATNWLLEPTDVIESANIDVSGYSNVYVQYDIAGNGTGTFMGGTFEYSLDGGTNWSAPVNTQTPTTTTLPNVSAFTSPFSIALGSSSITNFKMRFKHSGGCGRSLKIDNIKITANLPITCSSTTVGSNLSVGSYACLSACPVNPSATTICITFADMGNLSVSGCKFLNTYTEHFGVNTPSRIKIQSGQSFTALLSNFTPVSSPANTYQWRYLVVNPNGVIVTVVSPALHATLAQITNTTITPTYPVGINVVPGTHKIYGYYYNSGQTSAPVVGTLLASLSGNTCGSVSKNYAEFEILNPIMETITAECAGAGVNTCPNRYMGTISITGGYPQYANSKGIFTPQYIIGADKTYSPIAYTNEMTGWVSYGTTANYMNSYIAGQSFGVKTADDGNCTLYPSTLDTAVYVTPTTCQISIAGNVLYDRSGANISGFGINEVNDLPLYAYLVSNTSTPCVVAKVAINADGTYAFTQDFAPNSYRIYLSTDPSVNIGANAAMLPNTALPITGTNGIWSHVAEGLVVGNDSTGDGAANGILSGIVVTSTSNITNANFALASSTPLPVTLVSFNGKMTENNALLSWNTIKEQNIDRFGIEYSVDGLTFSEIGNAKAVGNINTLESYQFLHENISFGKHYYRLKIKDIDGGFSYSDNVVILEKGVSDFFSLAPNPAHDKVTLNYPVLMRNTKLKIIDMQGRLIKIVEIPAYSNQTTLDIENMQEGVYMIIWNGELSQKLVIY